MARGIQWKKFNSLPRERMQISKSDFLYFLRCPKSFWLLKHRPNDYPKGEFSDYAQKIASEGYEVEAELQKLVMARPDASAWSFQVEFATDRGLFALADAVRKNADGTIDLCEVKSSTSVKRDVAHNQIKDVAFQVVTAEESGTTVFRAFIAHLDKNYIRQGDIDPEALLTFTDVTEEVRALEAEVREEIDTATALLSKPQIDETSCTCLTKTRANHCDAFDYFNPDIPSPSIYDLPRISAAKLEGFVNDGRFSLDQISFNEVTAGQVPVLKSAFDGAPVIDQAAIKEFYAKAEYPLWFLDYETYSSAIPIIDGARPQAPIPFQFSLHVKRTPEDEELQHHEYLAEEAALPRALVEHLENCIGPTGSVISWHASFENTQNRNMAELYPDKARFLTGLIDRTLDLEDLFKKGYVDIAFCGSTSIKKVLPVLAKDLSYDGMPVANGTDAMEAWVRLISMSASPEKDRLRANMLEYCKLDTYAMVRLFEVVERL